MDDLQSEKIWSPTTPAVTDLKKLTGKEESRLQFLGFYGGETRFVVRGDITGGENGGIREITGGENDGIREITGGEKSECRLRNLPWRETSLGFRKVVKR
ncbi:hypothetical protein F2Q68_00026905 [Brassica cretica]|uniref:Uncharacterized protein n=1 Tax=Brassica cretica TaxID=69181 RepID=A0A8S9ID68_BRACR|nr:hypothetical protein F2Q68_00026905 [Brassica cretica]